MTPIPRSTDRRHLTRQLLALGTSACLPMALHELVLGTREALVAHAELMKKHPGMEHDEPYMAHVDAGRRGEITWTFKRPDDFEFACLIPGHFEAGMRGTLRVTPKP